MSRSERKGNGWKGASRRPALRSACGAARRPFCAYGLHGCRKGCRGVPARTGFLSWGLDPVSVQARASRSTAAMQPSRRAVQEAPRDPQAKSPASARRESQAGAFQVAELDVGGGGAGELAIAVLQGFLAVAAADEVGQAVDFGGRLGRAHAHEGERCREPGLQAASGSRRVGPGRQVGRQDPVRQVVAGRREVPEEGRRQVLGGGLVADGLGELPQVAGQAFEDGIGHGLCSFRIRVLVLLDGEASLEKRDLQGWGPVSSDGALCGLRRGLGVASCLEDRCSARGGGAGWGQVFLLRKMPPSGLMDGWFR